MKIVTLEASKPRTQQNNPNARLLNAFVPCNSLVMLHTASNINGLPKAVAQPFRELSKHFYQL